MTHAFRTFVDVYTMTIISSDYENLTLSSILIFPAIHLLKFISQQSLWPWLPESTLFSFQVKAEIQFQKKRLINALRAALDDIDTSSLTTQLSQNSSSHHRYLEAAIDTVTIHQQSVREMIDRSDYSLWGWICKLEETAKFERYYKLGELVRGHLLVVKETMDDYEVYYKRLVGDLHGFRQSFKKRPLSGFLAQSSLAVPAPLLAQVHNICLLSRGHSSRIDDDGNSRDTTYITSHPHVFPYDLGSTYDTRLSSLRSEVA